MDVGVDSTYNMLCELAEQSNNTWYIDGRRVLVLNIILSLSYNIKIYTQKNLCYRL